MPDSVRPPHLPIPHPQRENYARGLAAGQTPYAMARELGLSTSTTHRWQDPGHPIGQEVLARVRWLTEQADEGVTAPPPIEKIALSIYRTAVAAQEAKAFGPALAGFRWIADYYRRQRPEQPNAECPSVAEVEDAVAALSGDDG